MDSKSILVLFLINLLLLGAGLSSAQQVGNEVFLKGTYLEVGVSRCGSYGTKGQPPTSGNYHPTELGLGFVADQDQDGWTVGSPIYCGDYFLPGSPVEGWSLEINGIPRPNANTNTSADICLQNSIIGNNTSYSSLGGVLSTTWEGSIDNIYISITTTFPDTALYFVGNVLLCNNSNEDISDLYFLRHVDPDNDAHWTGNYNTTNNIVSQPGTNSFDALVTARGESGCFIGLGSRSSNAKVSWGGFNVPRPSDVYNGIAPFSQSGQETSDIGMSLAFKIASLPVGNCECFSYAYVLNANQLETALSATEAIRFQFDENDITNSLEAYACVGDTFDLSVSGGENWTWTDPLGNPYPGNEIKYLPTVPDTLYFTATGDVGSCGISQRIITIYATESPDQGLNLGPDLYFCNVDTVALNAFVEGGTNYYWQDGTIGPAYNVTSSGTYNVVVRHQCLGVMYDTIDVIIDRNFETLNLGLDQIVCLGNTIQLDANTTQPNATYQWNTGSTNSSLTISDAGFYSVTVTSDVCISTDEIQVTYEDCSECEITFIPNVFSPNYDGINDEFRPFGCSPSVYELKIFDRWGQLLFVSNSISDGWDGKLNGQFMNPGVYVYIIDYVNLQGEKIQKTGDFTLLD